MNKFQLYLKHPRHRVIQLSRSIVLAAVALNHYNRTQPHAAIEALLTASSRTTPTTFGLPLREITLRSASLKLSFHPQRKETKQVLGGGQPCFNSATLPRAKDSQTIQAFRSPAAGLRTSAALQPIKWTIRPWQSRSEVHRRCCGARCHASSPC